MTVFVPFDRNSLFQVSVYRPLRPNRGLKRLEKHLSINDVQLKDIMRCCHGVGPAACKQGEREKRGRGKGTL